QVDPPAPVGVTLPARAAGQVGVVDAAVVEQAALDVLVVRHDRVHVLQVVEARAVGDLIQRAHGDQLDRGRCHGSPSREGRPALDRPTLYREAAPGSAAMTEGLRRRCHSAGASQAARNETTGQRLTASAVVPFSPALSRITTGKRSANSSWCETSTIRRRWCRSRFSSSAAARSPSRSRLPKPSSMITLSSGRAWPAANRPIARATEIAT